MPEGDLLNELLSLSDAASRTVDYLRAPNFPLPASFPTDQLREICFSLGALHMGTAHGCRVPLEYARSRLPAIRAEHVPNARSQASTKDDMSLQRGLGIDPHLADLIATVATALDAYRRDYISPVDDAVTKELGVETTEIDDVQLAVDEGRQVDIELEIIRSRSEHILGSSAAGENYRRRVSDVKSLNLLAMAELRGRVVVRWFRTVVSALQRYPEALRVLGKTLQGVSELSRPAVKAWSAFQDDIADAALNRLERLGVSYEEIAEKIELRRADVSQSKQSSKGTSDPDELLKRRNDDLVAADALKDAFVENVGYEMRSPLTNIIGFADLLASSEVGTLTERQRAYTDYIRASSITLGVLIDNILDLASADAGIAELRPELQDVTTLVDKARAGLSASFPEISGEKPINLVIAINDHLPPFVADGTRMVQVLYSLLSNAARFSPPNGEIKLTVVAHGDQMLFVIEDEGPGLTDEMKSILNSPDNSNGRSQGGAGLGLGLVIARTFVRLHGGTINAEGALRGSKITVSLPLGSNVPLS